MTLLQKPPTSRKGEPVWEIASLFPNQGHWSEEEYLALETSHFIEFSDSYIEVLPMPTLLHQMIVAFLYQALFQFTQKNQAGTVLFAPLPVRLRPQKYREPDIVFLTTERLENLKGDYPEGADLVMEVVSGGKEDRDRDLVTKRKEYAQAGISEYWIVDPKYKRITVLSLGQDTYLEHGKFEADDTATSVLLAGFTVAVNDVFAAAEED